MQTNRIESENKIKRDSTVNFGRLDAFNCHHQRQHKKNNNGKLSTFSFLHHIFLGKFIACDCALRFTLLRIQIQINAKQGINYQETKENFFQLIKSVRLFSFFQVNILPTQQIQFNSYPLTIKRFLCLFSQQQSVVLLILDIDLRPSQLTVFFCKQFQHKTIASRTQHSSKYTAKTMN